MCTHFVGTMMLEIGKVSRSVVTRVVLECRVYSFVVVPCNMCSSRLFFGEHMTVIRCKVPLQTKGNYIIYTLTDGLRDN